MCATEIAFVFVFSFVFCCCFLPRLYKQLKAILKMACLTKDMAK